MKKCIIMISLSAFFVTKNFAQNQEDNPLQKWSVASIKSNDVPAQLIYVSFDPTTNTLFGKSACNNFNGLISFNPKKQTFKTGNFISTMMMCDEEKMKWENEFMMLISNQKKLNYVHENRMIRVFNKKKEVMVLHKYNEEAPSGSTNPSYVSFMQENKWKLIQMEGENYMNNDVYLEFDISKNQIFGKSACNRYFGSYNIKGETIEIGMLGGTKMACENEINIIESRFLEILSNRTLRFDIADQVLNLYQNDRIVLMFGLMK